MSAKFTTFDAPVKGLQLNRSPTEPDAKGAEVIENGIPTQRGVRVRGGRVKRAECPAAITSFLTYNSPAGAAFFAATATAIYDITALDPDATLSADISSLTDGYWIGQQIGTVGGEFLMAVNGADSARLYDGTTWTTITGASSPAITGVTTSDLSHVWLYRSRLFFVEQGTMTAWYLPVDSVGGAASDVSMAGIFQRGGALFSGATWSLDSGDGLDDKCVFISTEGEVAIYEGSNPASADDWRLVGRYDVAKPLGRKGVMQAGGDLLIATTEGIVPLSQVITKDPAALSMSAVTRPIEPIWNYEAENAAANWELTKWSGNNLGLVTMPGSVRVPAVNLQTGAWAIETGWTHTCAAVFAGAAYIAIGTDVFSIDDGGLDGETPYTFRYCGSFADFGDPTSYKEAKQMRCVFYAPSRFAYRASISSEYTVSFPPAPPSVTASSDYMTWDVSDWDETLWWSPSVEEQSRGVTGEWRAVSGAGSVLAPTVQITSGSSTKLNIELVRIDFSYEAGGRVV